MNTAEQAPIGFIGLGRMGSVMARRLLDAGHSVLVYNRSPGPAEDLAQAGAQVAAELADFGRVKLVITITWDDAALEDVVFAQSGLLSALQPGSTHVNLSTVSVGFSQRLAEAHRSAGQFYVAAPVFGRPDAAAAGRLTLVVGGDPEGVAAIKPLLPIFGAKVVEVGLAAWRANLLKLLGNQGIFCAIELLGEMFGLSEKAGLDSKFCHEALVETLFPGPIFQGYSQRIRDRAFDAVAGDLHLALKDTGMLLEAAEKLSMPLPFASVIRDRVLAGIAEGHGRQDVSALARQALRASETSA